jgi:Zn-dependent protease with chaperone function
MTQPPLEAAHPKMSELTKPSANYKRRAWLAVASLIIFLTAYFALAFWFSYKAYDLTIGAGSGKHAFFGWIAGACAGFLAIFMLKALLFVRKGGNDDSVEITAQTQPELFSFLHELADKAGAPRPHKVFLSARVNAAVFYDLSLLNLFFPSKKNLEIGLGLVNCLSIGEFKAVLAHEFGHFAQRAMAVGRWVYIAQQIAAHLVAKRDKLDGFLSGLSSFDIRVAWVGWILSTIVWSIRSLVDSAFQVVVLIQRALSREMEMNADLVAVSLTGSDALINALHRLQAADDAWGRALAFVSGEKEQQKLTEDFFAIQTQILSQLGRLYNDPDYGKVLIPADVAPSAVRLFKADLAQPPQMWLTHPLNHEREANAKRIYINAPIDDRSAWVIFSDAQMLKVDVTKKLLATTDGTVIPTDQSIKALNLQFDREHLNARYRGVYFGRSITRHQASVDGLIEDVPIPSAAQFQQLYPQLLSKKMEQLRLLEGELDQFKALHKGVLRPTGGALMYHGKEVSLKQLPKVIARIESALVNLNKEIDGHDRQVRSVHLKAAKMFGDNHYAYLKGLLAAIHYSEHTEANLRDLSGLLGNRLSIETATRKVSAKGLTRILVQANELHASLEKVYAQASTMTLDSNLSSRLEIGSWQEAIGAFDFPIATKENINDWIKAIDSWVERAAGWCAGLRRHSLELMLQYERTLANHVADKTVPSAPPGPSVVPTQFATFLRGSERERQTTLSLWARFQLADGRLPAAARLVVAGSIVAGVLGFGGQVGGSNVMVYNGLARTVQVKLGKGPTVNLAAGSYQSIDVDNEAALSIQTQTDQGETIETFQTDTSAKFGQFVYNVASASPLVEWTAVYGNTAPRPEKMLGAARWANTAVDHLFTEPPTSIKTKGGGGSRDVLSGFAKESSARQLDLITDPAEQKNLIMSHARWDAIDSARMGEWLFQAQALPGFKAVLTSRLIKNPESVLLLRFEQDNAGETEKIAVCEKHKAKALAKPKSLDWQYLTVRCMPDGADKSQAFEQGFKQLPTHPWFAYAASGVAAERGRWQDSLDAAKVAQSALPAMRDSLAIDMARVHRLLKTDDPKTISALTEQSRGLGLMLALESGQGLEQSPMNVYSMLAKGKLAEVVKVSSHTPATFARLLRMAAASDGADGTMIAKAFALPLDQGLDDMTAWQMAAMAVRAGKDYEPYLKRVFQYQTQYQTALVKVLNALKNKQTSEQIDLLIDGLPTELRGHAYTMGLIVLGKSAPSPWREGAKRLLFISERPYFE